MPFFPPKIPSQRSQLPGREAQSCFLGAAGGEDKEGIPGPGRAPRAVLWDDPMEWLLRFGFQGCVRELCSARDATETGIWESFFNLGKFFFTLGERGFLTLEKGEGVTWKRGIFTLEK